MTLQVLTPRTLLGVYTDERLAAPSSYWRTLGGFDSRTVQSLGQDIVFETAITERKIAPFVLPTSTGRPIYKRLGSAAKSFRPAYIKPKDALMPQEAFQRQPGDLFTETPRTPEQNRDAEVVRIMRLHRDTIERRLEWMCAMATIYGQVPIEYEDGPTVTVDFGRDPNLTVIKNADYWDESFDIIGELEEFADTMTTAEFGGIPTRLTMGTQVWAKVRKNEGFKELMDLTMKNSNVNIQRGLVTATSRENNVRYVGSIGNGGGADLDLYVYNDFYQDDAGNQVPYMDPREIVLTAPSVEGVMAYGAIMDHDANLRAVPVFPKMWTQPDPSGIFIMTQSAPLPILPFPNRTFRARVLA